MKLIHKSVLITSTKNSIFKMSCMWEGSQGITHVVNVKLFLRGSKNVIE